MSELKDFIEAIASIAAQGNVDENINLARQTVKELNRFLYNTHDGIGTTYELAKNRAYISDFHKYWHKHHKEILNLQIDESSCTLVADVLHSVFIRTSGKAFGYVYDRCGLSDEEVCHVRFLTANQDFRGSRSFAELAAIYKRTPDIFNLKSISNNPQQFLNAINVSSLSQTDKRITFAKSIANFVLSKNTTPYQLIDLYNRDLVALKNALINERGTGFKEKKANMFIRDMYVHGVWDNVTGIEQINVPSDINTMQVAMRTGIVKSSIPLLSSFMDMFSYQYDEVDKIVAEAWKRVWEIWCANYPKEECLESPVLLDYFIYNTVGKEFCKNSLYLYECAEDHHFSSLSSNIKLCPICKEESTAKRKALPRNQRGAVPILKTPCIHRNVLPCTHPDGHIAIEQTTFYQKHLANPNFFECPFRALCDQNGKRSLQAPKSISISALLVKLAGKEPMPPKNLVAAG
ncbi:hypothetical protein [Selenomonas sp. ND2010]|uniref:hypothetical protein n=1 Tax=Selenomonas sp. ND2010 TaxID=1410618 RepID=UPI000691F5D6|nr:hypothetical protein [Selenomonas sp. ND2010]